MIFHYQKHTVLNYWRAGGGQPENQRGRYAEGGGHAARERWERRRWEDGQEADRQEGRPDLSNQEPDRQVGEQVYGQKAGSREQRRQVSGQEACIQGSSLASWWKEGDSQKARQAGKPADDRLSGPQAGRVGGQ
jgi:hypothetical protein